MGGRKKNGVVRVVVVSGNVWVGRREQEEEEKGQREKKNNKINIGYKGMAMGTRGMGEDRENGWDGQKGRKREEREERKEKEKNKNKIK